MEETNVKKINFKMPSSLLTSILWLIVGVILLIFPGKSLDTICRIAGMLVLIVGIIQIVVGLLGSGTLPGQVSVAAGAVIAILGLFVVIRPDILVSALPFVAGIIIVVHGATSLINSVQLIGAKDKYWWLGLLLSILTIGLGALLFFRSHEASEFVARIIGIFLIYGSVSNLWIHSRKARAARLRKQEEEALDVEATITDAE